MTERPKLVCIVGPTAAGKTGLAVEICRRWDGEIVGADASQIYTGFDIGTGKATPEELGSVRHHLIDVCAPDGPFDAERYRQMADAAVADIAARGRRAVICGGTGLYLDALLRGLCQAPPVAPEIRAELQADLAEGRHTSLHRALAEVDPAAAARISPNDGHRIERALGVWRTSGRALSDWQAEHAAQPDRYDALVIGVTHPRDILRQRIETRVAAMFAAGWADEVRALIADGWGTQLRSMNALGYRFVAQAVCGELPMKVAQRKTVTATWRYAKRQMTWFKKSKRVHWLEPGTSAETVDALIASFWRENSL